MVGATGKDLRQFAVEKEQDAEHEDDRADNLVFAQRFFQDDDAREQQNEGRNLRQHLRGGGGEVEERGAEQPEVADQAEDADENQPAVLQEHARVGQTLARAQKEAEDEGGGGETAGDDSARRDDRQDLLQDERQRCPHQDGDEGEEQSFERCIHDLSGFTVDLEALL